MKRTRLVLLLTLVSCFSVTAQTAKTKRPALPSNISAMAGQDSATLLNHPEIQTRMKKLLGDKYSSFMESFETLNPVTREGDYLFSSGCLVHACTHLESAIAVDLVKRTVHAAIFRQGEQTRYFNEGGKATPGVIRGWANNLRRMNTGTSSESKGSFVTTNVALAQVETSPPGRLRNRVPVRGFIGGESHDGYVVRARKGQVMTVRLDWRREGDNRASLTVSESADFYTGEPVKFGSEYDDGRRWIGTVQRTGDYYFYVVAHPSAHYTLRVSLR